MGSALWIIAIGLVLVAGYVRLAPSDPAKWHVMRDVAGNRDMKGGVLRLLPNGAGDMARLDEIIRATPHTSVLAGSVNEGMVTYVTRSAIVGFPDYTTIRRHGAALEIYARLRFGSSDMGVNGRRVGQWLAALGGQ